MKVVNFGKIWNILETRGPYGSHRLPEKTVQLCECESCQFWEDMEHIRKKRLY